MRVAIPKETRPGETRVAATPESVKKLKGLGLDIIVQAGAGVGAKIADADYLAAGATIAPDAASTVRDADIVLMVRGPQGAEIANIKKGAVVAALLSPHTEQDNINALAAAGITAFAMEFLPRISRAQSMDVLSSQANLAGYKAVVDAAATFGRAMPMMMTAQVESLGGTFVAVMDEEFKNAQTAAGYAKPMSPEYQAKQAALTAETIKKQDIVITTALIPGRKAPILVTEEMIKTMKPGSVIVDLAAGAGGNTPLSKPDEVVEAHGVTILGPTNLPGALAVDASSLYARNLFNFLSLIVDKKTGVLALDWNDEIVKGSAVTKDGAPVPRG
ncbi:MAG: NAD(P) transhydrogenase subunit alpha [Alphaproteobacteria bacterium]|nr:NAD(P) transhydrogenase subunit alpha [Alphaproteobacteria bacterium]